MCRFRSNPADQSDQQFNAMRSKGQGNEPVQRPTLDFGARSELAEQARSFQRCPALFTPVI